MLLESCRILQEFEMTVCSSVVQFRLPMNLKCAILYSNIYELTNHPIYICQEANGRCSFQSNPQSDASAPRFHVNSLFTVLCLEAATAQLILPPVICTSQKRTGNPKSNTLSRRHIRRIGIRESRSDINYNSWCLRLRSPCYWALLGYDFASLINVQPHF